MKILVARHGLSEANNRENYGTPAFDNPEAPLMAEGRGQARLLGELLISEYDIDVANETAAVSMMRRTQETAIVAGFRSLHLYPGLNEEKGGLDDSAISDALRTKQPPQATINAARLLIEHPPQEMFWAAHALLIAAMCQELGVYGKDRFIPKFCEVRELSL